MSRDEDIFERIGELAASQLGAGPSPQRSTALLHSIRNIAFQQQNKPGKRYRLLTSKWVMATGLGLVMLLGAAFLLYAISHPKRPDFRVANEPGSYGDWLQASIIDLPIQFEDGSKIDLYKKSEGRIFSDRDWIRVVLEKGSVSASIHPGGTNRWTVEAGPYSVTALGTIFSVHWHASDQVLEVEVNRGVVQVEGPGIKRKGIQLRAGDHLRMDQQQGDEQTPEQIDPEPAQKTPAIAGKKTNTAPKKKHNRSQGVMTNAKIAHFSKPETRTWKQYHHERLYEAAVRAARQQGLVRLLRELDDADLWLLASAARFAHDVDVANRALLAIRKRFKGSWRCRVASFLLGRVAMELKQDASQAIFWFKVYLQEDPQGALSEEALGRLIGAYQQSGQRFEALECAQTYIEKYRNGHFTALARSVLGL